MEPMHYIASRLITEIDIDLVSSPSDNNVHPADLTQPNDNVYNHIASHVNIMSLMHESTHWPLGEYCCYLKY